MKLSKNLFQVFMAAVLVIGSAYAGPIRPGPGQGRVQPAPRRPMPAPMPRANQLPSSIQQITLNLNHQSQGHAVLPLKQLIKAQHPRLNLQQLKLKSVALIAKSQMGRATAKLKVGQQSSYPETIPGGPQLYRLPGPQTFSRVSLQVPFFQQIGAMASWQIELNGNVKVKQIRVRLSR